MSWLGPRPEYISHLLRELGRLDLALTDIESHDRPPHTRTVLSDLLAYRETANEAFARLIDWQRLDLAQMRSRVDADPSAKPRIEVSAEISQMNNLSVRWYPAGYHRSCYVVETRSSGRPNDIAQRKWDSRPDFTYFTGDEQASFQGRATNELMYVRGVGSLRPAPRDEYGQYAKYNHDVVDAILICAVRSAYETLIQQLEMSFEVEVLDAFDFAIREESDPGDSFTEKFPIRRVVDWRLEDAQQLRRAREKEAALQQRQHDEAELARVEEKFGFSLEKLIGALERASAGLRVDSVDSREEANRKAAKELRAAGFKVDAGHVRRIRQLIQEYRSELFPECLRPLAAPVPRNVIPFNGK